MLVHFDYGACITPTLLIGFGLQLLFGKGHYVVQSDRSQILEAKDFISTRLSGPGALGALLLSSRHRKLRMKAWHIVREHVIGLLKGVGSCQA